MTILIIIIKMSNFRDKNISKREKTKRFRQLSHHELR